MKIFHCYFLSWMRAFGHIFSSSFSFLEPMKDYSGNEDDTNIELPFCSIAIPFQLSAFIRFDDSLCNQWHSTSHFSLSVVVSNRCFPSPLCVRLLSLMLLLMLFMTPTKKTLIFLKLKVSELFHGAPILQAVNGSEIAAKKMRIKQKAMKTMASLQDDIWVTEQWLIMSVIERISRTSIY